MTLHLRQTSGTKKWKHYFQRALISTFLLLRICWCIVLFKNLYFFRREIMREELGLQFIVISILMLKNATQSDFANLVLTLLFQVLCRNIRSNRAPKLFWFWLRINCQIFLANYCHKTWKEQQTAFTVLVCHPFH